ncbi:serine/threonine-protein kinase csk1 [Rhypophila decipiens]|uniref:cyclin-dependent kinase n=1 Tax=Rhypophila decipiens TaxID=261697 RepID=A0AAN6Y7T0_9PEZI|nr:serine/threonine-protein kinase csk1 [Rhypophila decipiens]
MASSSDWRSSLTASERYDNIQKLTESITAAGLSQNAFSLETEAYKNCSSRAEYDAACSLTFDHPEPKIPHAEDEPPYLPASVNDDPEHEADSTDPGIRIGPYQNCQYVASGVTAEVYRHKDKALKVIVETRDIEPHNPVREAKILEILSQDRNTSSIIPLLSTFRDHEQRFVLVFPYKPLTLSTLLSSTSPLPSSQIHLIFSAVFKALKSIHARSIIHRDIKPSAILLSSPNPTTTNEISLSDFGTAWHPTLSISTEPPESKILDIGTGPYRAPEVLFGKKSYSTPVDMWAAGVMLSECVSPTGNPIFESRPVHEDGNQLGLILSIFKTIGSPTRESWPEAVDFRTPPFEIYRAFDERAWDEVLPGVEARWRDMVGKMVRYESSERATARDMLLELEGMSDD